MLILALDAATDACSACLWHDGDVLLRHAIAPRQHASLLLPWVREVLAEAESSLGQLDALAVTKGPGSFTGVRIGFSAAQGLALGAGIGLVTRSTLETMAETARRENPERTAVVAALDARMDEVYVGAYRRAPDGWGVVVSDQVVAPAALSLPDDAWHVVGPGASVHDDRLVALAGPRATVDRDLLPRADALAALAADFLKAGGVAEDPALAEPAYLRNQVARKPG